MNLNVAVSERGVREAEAKWEEDLLIGHAVPPDEQALRVIAIVWPCLTTAPSIWPAWRNAGLDSGVLGNGVGDGGLAGGIVVAKQVVREGVARELAAQEQVHRRIDVVDPGHDDCARGQRQSHLR